MGIRRVDLLPTAKEQKNLLFFSYALLNIFLDETADQTTDQTTDRRPQTVAHFGIY